MCEHGVYSKTRNITLIKTTGDWDVAGEENDGKNTHKYKFPAHILTGVESHTGTESLL